MHLVRPRPPLAARGSFAHRLVLASSAALALSLGVVACGEDPSDIDANRPPPETTAAEAPEEEVAETTTSAAPVTEAPVPTGDSVEIADFAFDPAAIEVSVGGELTWTNTDSAAHSIATADGSFGSVTLDQGDEFTQVFAEAGTYAYFCGIHNAMTGSVVVS
jgi:plastocyanin